MDREFVDSSNIASIGYDGDSLILEVEFLQGGVYQYYNVPEHVYRELMSAASHGSYLAHNIKGSYEYARI
ncbi:KTSC domain-containing protein [Kordiimonas laminariae]|uniref:KTSC domain-containing protein n=1 Tax=Kordiimonas laminariae TaxID=2917717 RepID=UPI001FF50F84|nr:KTSC domain-containing protein [Kordiimonas laminariae]MCK0070854.1 KTSC domain-containing protein [Kordiimonas laminariae]